MFLITIYLTILSVCLISSQNIEIKIDPEIIIIGQNLFVACLVSGTNSRDRFDVYLRCPFNNGDSRCIQNCKSRDACNDVICNDKAVGDQQFSCNDFGNSTNIAYNYYFVAVTKAFLNYSKMVNFACLYKGQQVNRQAHVLEILTTIKTISTPKKTPIFDTSTYLVTPPEGQSESSKSLPDSQSESSTSLPGIMNTRFLIFISLISALFASFLVNVYCSVQLCMSRSKKKYKRENRSNNQTPSSYPLQDINSNPYSNETSSQYISHDNIKRTKSQPSLSNNEGNTPTRSNYNYSSLSNTESVVSRLKASRPTTLTMDNEISNGSRSSLLTPIYGQPAWSPIHPQFVYLAQYPTIFIPTSPINVDNLDRVVEQEGPERQNSSLCQPLPQKPDETFSDLESVFS